MSETPSIATDPFGIRQSAKAAAARDEELHVLAPAAQLAHAPRLVDVALHDVPVEARIRAQRALEIHARARAQLAQRRALERLAHGLEAQAARLGGDHREAGPVHRDAVAHAHTGRDRRRVDREAGRLAARDDLDHVSQRLDDAR